MENNESTLSAVNTVNTNKEKFKVLRLSKKPYGFIPFDVNVGERIYFLGEESGVINIEARYRRDSVIMVHESKPFALYTLIRVNQEEWLCLDKVILTRGIRKSTFINEADRRFSKKVPTVNDKCLTIIAGEVKIGAVSLVDNRTATFNLKLEDAEMKNLPFSQFIPPAK